MNFEAMNGLGYISSNRSTDVCMLCWRFSVSFLWIYKFRCVRAIIAYSTGELYECSEFYNLHKTLHSHFFFHSTSAVWSGHIWRLWKRKVFFPRFWIARALSISFTRLIVYFSHPNVVGNVRIILPHIESWMIVLVESFFSTLNTLYVWFVNIYISHSLSSTQTQLTKVVGSRSSRK